MALQELRIFIGSNLIYVYAFPISPEKILNVSKQKFISINVTLPFIFSRILEFEFETLKAFLTLRSYFKWERLFL